MFSLIICSRNNDICDELKKNISLTIGSYKYEIIVVNNSKNEYSIFQAYNVGVRKAKFQYLCFMHEDILYLTNNWGGYVIKEFNNQNMGMLGVLGGYYIGKYALTYYSSGYNTGQFIDKSSNLLEWRKDIYGTDVVTIDGLWMCIRKELFDSGKVKWDDETYPGFHYYDLDMSMQVLHSGFRIGIVKGLYIQHFSVANFNKTFYMNSIRFHKKWNFFLPQCASGFVLPADYKEGLWLTVKSLIRGKFRAEIYKLKKWINNKYNG